MIYLFLLVKAVLSGDDLSARQWVKYAKNSSVEINWSCDNLINDQEMVVGAALTEWLCSYLNLECPDWASSVNVLKDTLYLTEYSKLESSPEPFKKRNVAAPSEYLMML